MQKYVLSWMITQFLVFYGLLSASGAVQPATVGKSSDSFAMQLHYPAKEKTGKAQGAVKFYCQVGPDGKPTHISTLNSKGQGHFATAVEFALYHGRFNPATFDGKPVTVILGGTVLFLINNAQPTIAVVLATAESEKVASMNNYQQPQMLDTDVLFRRKCFAIRDKYHLYWGAHPGAVVLVHVDAEGNPVSKSIESESPPNGGHGRLLLDVVGQEHFIPAQSNGKALAGDFELAVDFEHMRNPDGDAPIGSLIRKDNH